MQQSDIMCLVRSNPNRKGPNKMAFYGRYEQIKKLNNLLKEENLQVALIYGRRRVGKSELVKQVIKQSSIKSIYYECKQTTEVNNVASLCRIVSERLNLPKLGYTRIEDLLDYLFKYSENEKILLVLDEYSYLSDTVKGMDSILQSLIDQYKDSSKMCFVILGSYIDTMKSLLEHSNPLFGRIDLVIDLKPMDYKEAALFYPNYEPKDKVKIYSVFGGIPYYNRLIDDRKSVKENIIDLIASPGARLENEIIMYLKSEIKKIINANEVFETLAKGVSKYSDILSQSNVSSGPTLIDVLDKLIKMEIVEKKAPINDQNNKKKAGYYICDNLSLFYYRYVFRYSSQLNIMDSDVFYKKYIEKDFEEIYVPLQFENICKQYLINQNKKGEIDPVFEKIGKYYYDDPIHKKNGEFDIVTEDENGYVFYEVKFKNQPLSKSMIEKEIEQVNQTKLNCYKYVFISKSGFEEFDLENVELISIQDLF